MEMEKKEYSAPELTVVEMDPHAPLLDGSCKDYGDCDDIPLGFAPTSNDHLA